MRDDLPMTIDTTDGLREIYRPASGGAVAKVISVLDDHCRDFLAKSPFFVLSTADGEGVCDGSPKGGAPGFVEMLDDHRVAWADYSVVWDPPQKAIRPARPHRLRSRPGCPWT